ncbi:MAG: ORF6N domain-containing protein [Kiritimatiellae bacterium]|nr:ORF6N domain-containing protein [Kiritimatiellia bacterium]
MVNPGRKRRATYPSEGSRSNLPARIAPQDVITRIRGHAVILDADLAALYGVPVKRLNEQVRRNKERFPENFMFQLTLAEWDSLRSQIATASTGRIRSQFATASKRNIRYMPYAFTEHGAIMAATILNSPKAIQMSIAVVSAFVNLRRMVLSVEALARKLAALEGKYDKQFKVVFDAIRRLMSYPPPSNQVEGFHDKKV